jgi:hypothetical protein
MKGVKPTRGMSTFAGQGCQPLTHRPIEALNEGGVEHRSSFGTSKQLQSVF